MSHTDLDRLKADASGNTGLSEALEQAVDGFSDPREALDFLAARGFHIPPEDLASEARDAPAEGEGGYGALMRFIAERRLA